MLLVEDDDGDAVLFEELLVSAGVVVQLTRARSLEDAVLRWCPEMDAVALDLGLPDSAGLDGVVRLQRVGAGAVVVLTGLDDQSRGVAAVAAGAQDYLVKGQIDGRGLERALRYAAARYRVEVAGRELSAARLLAGEQARLGRGLLPTPLLTDPAVGFAAEYVPGGRRLLLGGDFYDVVQTRDATVWAVIGDVCGHGPDEAALGVCLRIAWRTLVLAGHPAHDILPTLQQLLIHERHHRSVFTTVCMLAITGDRARARVWLAGHPPPLLGRQGRPVPVPGLAPQVPLGVLAGQVWSPVEVELGARWELLLYTDGLIEGNPGGPGEQCLGVEGLAELLHTQHQTVGPDPRSVLFGLVAAVTERAPRHGDDVAALMLTHGTDQSRVGR